MSDIFEYIAHFLFRVGKDLDFARYYIEDCVFKFMDVI